MWQSIKRSHRGGPGRAPIKSARLTRNKITITTLLYDELKDILGTCVAIDVYGRGGENGRGCRFRMYATESQDGYSVRQSNPNPRHKTYRLYEISCKPLITNLGVTNQPSSKPSVGLKYEIQTFGAKGANEPAKVVKGKFKAVVFTIDD